MKLLKEQSSKIQLLRGLAIIAVVFIHNTPGGLAQVFLRPFVNFSVGLFLFLSGMLSSAENWHPKKRLQKVLIPYAIWTFIYVVSQNIESPGSIPVAFLKALVAGNAAAIMYYIFVYCQFTLLIPWIEKLANSKYKYLGFLFAPIEIIITKTLPLIAGIEFHKYIQMIISLSCLGWFTYFYLGYLLGNNKIRIPCNPRKLLCLWGVSIILQMLEGYWYLSCFGATNCGSQLKLSSVLSGVLFSLMAYHHIRSTKESRPKILCLLGDCSFGIYFSHIAVMTVLKLIPHYSTFVIFPANAIVTLIASLCCVLIGKKILGKYSHLLAL